MIFAIAARSKVLRQLPIAKIMLALIDRENHAANPKYATPGWIA